MAEAVQGRATWREAAGYVAAQIAGAKQRPVVALESGQERALLLTAHRDEPLCVTCQFKGRVWKLIANQGWWKLRLASLAEAES